MLTWTAKRTKVRYRANGGSGSTTPRTGEYKDSINTNGKQDFSWSAQDVAEWLKISDGVVQRLARERKMPSIRVKQKYMFNPDRIKRWFQTHQELGTLDDLTRGGWKGR